MSVYHIVPKDEVELHKDSFDCPCHPELYITSDDADAKVSTTEAPIVSSGDVICIHVHSVKKGEYNNGVLYPVDPTDL